MTANPSAGPNSTRVHRFAQALRGVFSRKRVPLAKSTLDEYVEGAPCAQNAIDALPGWNTALPPAIGVQAGASHFYHDGRILWGLEQFGPLAGKRVLELGPLEASHTYMLEQHGAAAIDAVEANKLSFLRCLVVKELLSLKTARFHLGDALAWLEDESHHYDLIVASGVLYHMRDPILLLERMAARADAILLWTHYASESEMPKGDPRRQAFVGDAVVRRAHGVDVRMLPRSYLGAWQNKAFCGGMHDLHFWVEREDILALLAALGFNRIEIAFEQPNHPNGPAYCVFARRESAPAGK